jgi:hypothetical protein
MAYKAEVIADSSGNWAGNALVFATQAEAEAYVLDLSIRWTLVRETRTVETAEEPNYELDVATGVVTRLA